MRHRIIGGLAALGLGLTTLLVSPSAAGAHTTYQGSDYTTHSYDGTYFTVCDVESDGHAVWAGYYHSGSNAYKSAPVYYPPGGSGVNCTNYDVYPYYLTNLRTVEDNPNSSTNYYGAWHGYPVRHS